MIVEDLFPHFAPSAVPAASVFDLQLFAAEDEGRTEDPTSKKISKARSEGQVPKSQELVQVINLFLSFLVIFLIFPRIIGYEMRHVTYYLQNLSTLEFSHASIRVLILHNTIHILAIIWPIALVSMIASIGGNIAQVGWLFTLKPMQPKWSKIFPQPQKLVGKFIMGKEVLFNLLKSGAKLVGAITIAWSVISDDLALFGAFWKMTPFTAVETTMGIAFELVWKICLMLLILAALDYWYQRHQWKQNIMMKKEEVKDEHRQSEGDPEVKKAQRRKMMEVARRRMMREIPTADVVITNPTHYSIAVKYDPVVGDAPFIVAKGKGYLALKIRMIAEENGVPLYENKILARALYAEVEVGAAVPREFFRAVAEVLAYVMKQRKKAV